MHAEAVEPARQWVRASDGQMLAVYPEATGDGEPAWHVVFVHGFGGDAAALTALGAALADEIRRAGLSAVIVRWDLRGHGHSSRRFPTDRTDLLAVLADDLACVLTHVSPRRLLLVGHSLGGLVVQGYLGRPGVALPQATVLITPAIGLPRRAWLTGWWYRTLARGSVHRPVPAGQRTWADHAGFVGGGDFDRHRLWSDASRCGLISYGLIWLSLLAAEPPSLSVLDHESISVIHGLQDAVIPVKACVAVREALSRATVLQWPCNHNPVLSQPGSCATYLAGRLSR